jgi:hypothetical protein
VTLLTDDEIRTLRALIESSRWIFAKTMPHIPHWYSLRREAPDEARFEWFVMFIRERGERRRWGPYNHHYLDLDGWSYWTMGAPVEQTIVINRARIDARADIDADAASL